MFNQHCIVHRQALAAKNELRKLPGTRNSRWCDEVLQEQPHPKDKLTSKVTKIMNFTSWLHTTGLDCYLKLLCAKVC